jgi:hypothetical protein
MKRRQVLKSQGSTAQSGSLARRFAGGPAFLPTSIIGCGLWLDGADVSSLTFSSGSNISQWKDKSASSNHFNLTVGTSTAILDSGKPVVSFADATVMTSTNQISFSGISAFFIVSKMTKSTTDFQDLLGFPNIGNAFSLRFANNVLIFDELSTNYYVNGNLNPSYTSNAYLNTYSMIATTSPRVNRTTFISLSDNWLLSGFTQRFYKGNIAEFIFYPGGVRPSQRQKIEGYLAHKWGLQSTLPADHPFKSAAPVGSSTAPPLPISISGCQLWLDGADSSSLVMSGSNVITWKDKSFYEHNMDTLTTTASWTGTATYPTVGTSINGKSTVNFTPQAGLKQSLTLEGVTNLFWVGRIAAPIDSGGAPQYFLLGSDGSYDWSAGNYGGRFMDAVNAQASIQSASPTSLFTSDTRAVTNTTFNNVFMPTAPSVFLLSVAGIGGLTRYQGICYDRLGVHIGWCGDLAEVVIFNSTLTAANREKVEGYLAHKWGIQSTLPANHPYRNTAPSA